MYCPKCGRENQDEASFCQFCGASFTSPGQTPPPQSAPPTYQPVQPGPAVPGQKIPNHLVWAIISLLFFFLIGGIVAVVYAARVDGRLAAGDVAGAWDASNKAKTWCIVSTVIFVIWVVVAIIVRGVAGF